MTYLLKVETSVPRLTESAFDEWYTEVHLPEIVELPGFIAGSRYKLLGDNEVFPSEQAPFLAIYEVETLDALRTGQFQAARGFGPFQGVVRSRPGVYNLIASKRS
jgi:hypothetical protein